jgi:hypothetical protein
MTAAFEMTFTAEAVVIHADGTTDSAENVETQED